jgi:hypothetical protein
MRAIVAAGLAGVGLVLQGCGGGGDDSTCLAERMDLVSQSFSGTAEVSVDGSFNGTTVTTTVMTSFTEMLDLEKFNLREDASGSVDFEGQKATANTTQILLIGEKQAISYSSVDVAGTVRKECVIQKLPENTPPPAELAGLLMVLKPKLQQMAVCGGNDGTSDTWKCAANYSGPLPNPPVPVDLPVDISGLVLKDGDISEDVQMTKDSLLQSSSTSVSGELLNGSLSLASLKLTSTIKVTEAKAGGPSEADLTPDFDVNCTEAEGFLDLDSYLRAPGFSRRQLLQILEAAKAEQARLIAV